MNFTYEKLFKILRDNLIIIIAGGVLCFGIAFAYSKFLIDPVYYSEAKIIILSNDANPDATVGNINANRMLVDSYLAILDSNDFYKNVHKNLPDDIKPLYSVSRLKSGTSFSPSNNTEVIRLQFKTSHIDSPKTVTETIIESINSHFILHTQYQTSVTVVDSATESRVSGDRTRLFSVIGFIIGMAAVFVVAIIREALDIRIKTVKDIVEKHNMPVLGAIPTFKGKKIKKEEGING
jgi:capsular polysaccharide biosynthesis protein